MKAIFQLIAILLISFSSYAQSSEIKGKVTDASTGNPLPQASVWYSGSKGTTTAKDGTFTISCTGTVELTVSYIGYETFRQKVNCNSNLNIELHQTTQDLNEVEVIASSNPNKGMLYQPVSVAKIGKNEINRGTGLLLDDAINTNIPGVTMERRTFSAGQQFNIRGYGSGTNGTGNISSNFDGQGYKVYLNGIPVTDAEGITVMDDIDFGSIGNAEVIKGPAGTLYGQAISGVVNLNTKKAQPGQASIGQNVMIGSYGLQRYTTHLEIGKDRSSILANYGKQLYDGFMPHTNSQKDFVNVIGEFRPNEKQTINAYFGYSNSYDARNGELSQAEWDATNFSGNAAYKKNDAHSNQITFRTGIGYTYRFNDVVSNTTSIFGTGATNNSSSSGGGWTDKTTLNYGLRSVFNTRFQLEKGYSLSGITGVELQKQNAQTIGYSMVPDSFNLTGYNIIGAMTSNMNPISRTASAFTEWTLGMPNDFSLTAGLGWSGLGITLNNRFYSVSNNNPSNPNNLHKPTQYKNSFNDMFSPRIALNKVFAHQVSVYASFSQAFKAPVSSYFYVPLTGQVLTGLKPERGTQYEIGSKASLFQKRFDYQLAFFYLKFTDKFTAVAVPNPTNTATSYTYVVNGGIQNHFGIEGSFRGVAYQSEHNFFKTVSPFLNFAYADFHYGHFIFEQLSADKKSSVQVDYSNKVVAGVPPFTFNTGVDLTTQAGLYFNATYSYRAKMYFTSNNLNETDKNILLNSKIGYAHDFQHFGLDIFFGLNNITQHKNYAMVFLNQPSLNAYLPAPNKINYFSGVNLKYIF